MSNNNNDAFDLLNSEFANVELEKENARNLENLRRRQAVRQQAVTEEDFDAEDDEESGGSGCVGIALRLLLIVLLACALAWIVFMPEGSMTELLQKLSPHAENAYSWFAGFFDGDKEKSGEAVSSDSAEPVSSDDGQVSSQAATTAATNGSGQTSSDTASAQGDEGQNVNTGDSPYHIKVYRPSQIVVVYDSAGNPAKVFSCSSGKASTPTKLGDYSIRAKYRWRFMVGNCYTQYASSFSNGYLFHSIPYGKKNPGTMANSSYDKLGNPASSGCIRLCFRDSKWIYDNCPVGTPVQVVDETAPAGTVPEIIPERIKDEAHSGWDPTDDAPENPYNR